MPAPETILAFDFGVTVGQSVTGLASPLAIVANLDTGVDHDAIAALIREWRPAQLVVGIPTHADGSASDMHQPILAFIDELKRYGLPVATVDERYTSIEAEQTLKQARASGARGRISKEDIDGAAAVLIAERYLSSE